MNVNPGNTAAPLRADQATTPQLMTEGEPVSDNPSFVSTAPAENMIDGQITDGVPVMDVHGETIGNVASYDERAGTMVVRAGWFFEHDVHIPIAAIGDRSASGIYLTQAKDELMQQYGGATSGMTGQATGDMDRASTAGSTMVGTTATDTDAASMGAGDTTTSDARQTSGTTMSGATGMAPGMSAPQAAHEGAMSTMGDDRVVVRDEGTQGVLGDTGTATDRQDT